MQIHLEELRKADYNKAIQFAIKGMHFRWYMNSELLLNLYGRYFLYQELMRATQVIAAYCGGELAGVLLCEIKGEPRIFHSFWKSTYVKIFDLLQKTFVKDGVGPYDQANKEMLEQYCLSHSPDGEIIFLAANPDVKVKGVGSALLTELERRECGKEVYLYTDNACTYQFYEHRGFELMQSREVTLRIGSKEVPLRCLMYCKLLG